MASHDDRAIVFEREKRPFWTILAAVCVPPFGFAALLHRSRSRIVVTATEEGTGTAVTVYGTAPLNVRRGFAELRDA